jgi:hypothetical protein
MGRLLPEAIVGSWDKPVLPMPQFERQLLSEGDIQRLFVRGGVTTELADWQVLGHRSE